MEEAQNNSTQPAPASTPQSNPPQGSQTPAGDNTTLMGVLAYLGILVIIPFLVAKDNAVVKFHVKQGFVLLAIWIIVWAITSSMPYSFYFIVQLVNLALIVLSIIGIINVIQKKQVELPVVGSFAKHIPL